MSEAAAFLRAVCAHPDEDGPRLVYADWLDERGDPRGEFIRVQCELAKLTDDDPIRLALQDRERELYRANDWRSELPALPDIVWGSYHRGFVGSVVAKTPAAFLESADAIATAVPLQWLRFFQATMSRLPWLLRSPVLRQVRRLNLSGNDFADAGAAELSECPLLAGLTDLNVKSCGISDRGVRALAASPFVRHLHRLDLSRNTVGPAGLQALIEAPGLGRLRELVLEENQVRGPTPLQRLAELPGAARLTELNLSACALDAAGLRALTTSSFFTGLTRLDLAINGIGASELEGVPLRPLLPKLRWLNLRSNALSTTTSVIWRVLARFPALRHLDVSYNGISETTIRALLRSRQLDHLEMLDLSYNGGEENDRGYPNPMKVDLRRKVRDHFGPRVRC